ncbi:MAG: TrbG/VirB9 family P-type conjugative transfer protein [Sphingomonas sp.]|uniref:TrbG/VirB9 family P-type conjugative transfer protein n=1 Tax=Sphingomonas sp. TaxID=28214 RepID=UPI0035695FA5
MRLVLVLLALLMPVAVMAQVRPAPGPGDPRIQTVLYDTNQVVQLQVATGYQLTVEFALDERIENVAVGDSGAWQVTSNKRGDHLFIKAVQPGVTTNLTVVTDARSYMFDLAPLYGPLPDMAYTVRFTYPPTAVATVADTAPLVEPGRYKLGGTRAIRPSEIDDDGEKTYIVWPADKPLPAVFAIDEKGREMLVDGHMRDGQYVIDSVKPKLLFRLDKDVASAVRVKPRAKR